MRPVSCSAENRTATAPADPPHATVYGRLAAIPPDGSVSCGNTGIHRLDARIKIGAFLVYQICVLSWPPQEITGLLPFFLFPVCVIRLAGLPLGYLLKRTLWLLPVAVMIGLFNPLVDRTPMGEWFGIPVTQGMISFISIILRCMLTILGAFTLLASTGFAPLCRG